MADTCRELQMLSDLLNIKADISVIEGSQNERIPILGKKDGLGLKGLASLAKYLTNKSNHGIKYFYTDNPERAALVDQWLEYRVTNLDSSSTEKDLHITLQELDAYLADRVYFVGTSLTIADLIMYYGLHRIMRDLSFYDKERFINLSRWFNNVQHQERVAEPLGTVIFQRNKLYSQQRH